MAGIALTPLSGGDQFQFGAPLDDDHADPSIEALQERVDATPAPVWPSFAI